MSIEKTTWPFPSAPSGANVRYTVEIERTQGQYQGLIHQDSTQKGLALNNIQLTPDATITIKQQPITLAQLIDKLIEFDQQWLKAWFDERAQFELGLYLYQQLFGSLHPATIQPANGTVEIRIISEDEHINRLPWILLAHHGVFLTTSGWSLSLSHNSQPENHELPPSCRMLIIAPQPEGEADTRADAHISELQQMLSLQDSSYLCLQGKGENLEIVTTWPAFKAALKTFKPQVLYYYGHGCGDQNSSQLVFADQHNQRIDKSASDLRPLLQSIPGGPPLIAYINCCLGDAGGFLGVGQQLAGIIPAVVTNRTMAFIKATQTQGLAFWQNALLEGLPPHEATGQIRIELEEESTAESFGFSDTRWMTPVLYCNYQHWKSNPPKASTRLDRDPHWRLKLNRVSQFGQVFLQTYQMFMEKKPRALSYLWYGEPEQGLEIFHHRLKVELQEKLTDTLVYEVKPQWPTDLADPNQSFRDMLTQAFGINQLDHLAAHIRTESKSVSGRQTLVYIRHTPVTSIYTFHPQNLKTYLEWLNIHIVSELPPQACLLVGISYEVKNPNKFYDLLIEKEQLNALELSDLVFQLLDELEKINRKDIIDFLATHSIQVPVDIKDGILDKILGKTKGSYEKVLEELKGLERRAWRMVQQANQTKDADNNGKDDYDDVF